MKRSAVIVVGAAVAVAVVVALLMTGVVPSPLADPTSSSDPAAPIPDGTQFADGTLLPQERTVVAKTLPNGHLAVTESIVFDAADGSLTPLVWRIGGTAIGRFADDDTQQYGVIPTVVSVAAQEINPKTRAKSDVAVTHDETPFDDPYADTHVYRTLPANGWTKGQHALRLTYELTDVYLVAEGVSMAVLPLSFFAHPDSSRQRLNVTRVTMTGAKQLRCLANDRDFVAQQDCPGATATLRYHGDAYDPSVGAVAFVDPVGVTAAPATAPVRKN